MSLFRVFRFSRARFLGHLHLKTDEKWTFFPLSRPILLSFMWTWSIFSASHVEFCRPPKINHHISSFSFSVRTEKDFTFASLLDDHGILACSTGIYTNNERVGGKETRENKRKAENNEGNWIYYKAYT